MNPQGSQEGFDHWRDRMHEPALTVLLVVEFLLIFVVIPVNGLPVYKIRSLQVPLVSVTVSLAAIGTVVTIARDRLGLFLTFLAAAIAIAADLFRYEAPSALSTSTFLFAVLAFLFHSDVGDRPSRLWTGHRANPGGNRALSALCADIHIHLRGRSVLRAE